jgi:transposase-like protein
MSLPVSTDDGLTRAERRLALLIKKRNAVKPPKAKKNKPVLFDSLFSFFETFSTEAKCYEYVEALRWGSSRICPHCAHDRISTTKKAYHYSCNSCNEIFNVKEGSVLNEGKTSLRDWLTAIYLENAFIGGVTGSEIEKQLSLSKSTSTGLLQQIRRYGYNQLCFNNFIDKNHKESDSYIVDTTIRDGIDSQRHSYNRGQYGGTYKRYILVVVKQYGNARAFVTDGDTERDILPLVEKHIPGGKTICTNDEPAYENLSAKESKKARKAKFRG